MPLADSYQEGTDKAINLLAAQPFDPIEPEPKFSAWSVVPRAVIAAGAEVAGNVIDIAGAYGKTQSAYGLSSASPFGQSEAEQAQSAQLRADLESGKEELFRSPESSNLYGFARYLESDPLTAGKAEQLVFGVTKPLTKAIGSVVTMGPLVGATAFGISEGMTITENLAAQEVDKKTRVNVGVVGGATAAAGVLMPATFGATRLASAGIGAGANVGLGMAQREATSEILSNANYADIAAQYDPLDPTAIAIDLAFGSIIGGALFRGPARASKTAGEPPVSKQADVAAKPSEAAPTPTSEQVDAAMVHNLTIQKDIHDSTPPDMAVQQMQEADTALRQDAETTNQASQTVEQQLVDSKVVDTEGKPLIVYHGTTQNFTDFDPSFLGASHGAESAKLGFFFSSDPVVAGDYAGKNTGANIRPAYLDIRNPKIIHFDKGEGGGKSIAEMIMSAKTGGHDGVILRNIHDGANLDTAKVADLYVVFNEKQIKPAIYNSATLDSAHKDPLIRSVLNRAEAIKTESPDMPVALKEDGTHAKFAEEVDAIRKQAREGTDTELGAADADLMRAAADCFLSTGSGA